MENQKIINLLGNTQNEASKFRTINLVEINDESRAVYGKDNQVAFKTSTIRSNICDYSDAYILVSGAITITGKGAGNAGKQFDERKKE